MKRDTKLQADAKEAYDMINRIQFEILSGESKLTTSERIAANERLKDAKQLLRDLGYGL